MFWYGILKVCMFKKEIIETMIVWDASPLSLLLVVVFIAASYINDIIMFVNLCNTQYRIQMSLYHLNSPLAFLWTFATVSYIGAIFNLLLNVFSLLVTYNFSVEIWTTEEDFYPFIPFVLCCTRLFFSELWACTTI